MKEPENPDDTYDKNKDKTVEAAKSIINKYRDTYKSINPSVLFNLSELKSVTSQPKQEQPDAAFDKIQSHLGEAESSETLRQERWQGNIQCPYCNSTDIKRLSVLEQESANNYKYLCLACNATFNDDSETKIEGGTPPINSWMLCWYLLGCTNSLQYIASKLGLSVTVVEMMVQHMQKLFNTDQPMKHFMSFDEWSIKHGSRYKLAMQQALAKQSERFMGYSLGQEHDTAEVRRQRTRADKDAEKTRPFSPRPKL